jgi:hypothetical protein
MATTFNGDGGGEHTFLFLNRFFMAMTTIDKEMIKDGDKQIPNLEVQRAAIAATQASLDPLLVLVVAGTADEADNARFAHLSMAMKMQTVALDRLKEEQREMTDAADKGLVWLLANVGPTVYNVIEARRNEVDRMKQLRESISDIRRLFGGNAQVVRQRIDRELLDLKAVKTKVGLRELMTQIVKLRLHQGQQKEADPTVELPAVMSDMQAITHIRERLEKSDELLTLQTYLGKLKQRTWDEVIAEINHTCQEDIVVVNGSGGQKQMTTGGAFSAAARSRGDEWEGRQGMMEEQQQQNNFHAARAAQ